MRKYRCVKSDKMSEGGNFVTAGYDYEFKVIEDGYLVTGWNGCKWYYSEAGFNEHFKEVKQDSWEDHIKHNCLYDATINGKTIKVIAKIENGIVMFYEPTEEELKHKPFKWE